MSDCVTVITDWKKWGSFIGVEYALQIGRYARCPLLYDKVTQQVSHKPEVEYGVVCWVGEQGVQAKLVLNREELTEAGEMHVLASKLAMYANARNGYNPHKPSRYPHPLKPDTQLWSVTEVNKYALAKEGLLNWYHKKGVEGTLTLLREYGSVLPPIAELGLEQALQALESHKLRPIDLRDQAGLQGRTYHKLAMFFLQGKSVDVSAAPQWQKVFVSKFALWCSQVHLEPVAVEQMVYEEEPNPIAGTLDAIATVDRSWVEAEYARLQTPQPQEAR